MKKLLFIIICLLCVSSIAFAGGKWPSDYPKFHDKTICPDTAFTGKVTCDGDPVVGTEVIIDNFGSFMEWTTAITDIDGNYYSVEPLGYYRVWTLKPDFTPMAYFIHAKWRCGVIPFYFEVCQ